jgi:hypothetical protein
MHKFNNFGFQMAPCVCHTITQKKMPELCIYADDFKGKAAGSFICPRGLKPRKVKMGKAEEKAKSESRIATMQVDSSIS